MTSFRFSGTIPKNALRKNVVGVVLFAKPPLGKTRTETFTPKNPQLGLFQPLKAPKNGEFPADHPHEFASGLRKQLPHNFGRRL
jgi:hypothetical protein